MELFHQWVKLSILGSALPDTGRAATGDEFFFPATDAVIDAALANGLPVPPELDPGQWESYMGWVTGGAAGFPIGSAGILPLDRL